MTTVAKVRLWGRTIGAVSLESGAETAAFQYDPQFVGSGIEVSPITAPLSNRISTFPGLPHRSFFGLPGLLADSLPDKFGNTLIDAWLASQGRSPAGFNSVERLCYVGARGMGALEFAPAQGPRSAPERAIQVEALVELATLVLSRRADLTASFENATRGRALADLLRVGTSAAGARAKAVIAWNQTTNEVRSGQVDAGLGFEYWLLKFDGVGGNRDRELDDPEGYGAVEYGYSLMARAAGITMANCRLMEENGRRHFMTKRFDRLGDGGKLHLQSLAALAHFDFNAAGAYSYEQAFQVIRQLGLPASTMEEQFRRMVFNIVARNQDDHVKNIAFLMDKSGRWSLSPAFDVTYSYNPTGDWTSRHQMSCNGKRDGFAVADLQAAARAGSIKRARADAIIAQVGTAVGRWEACAEEAGVPPAWRLQIGGNLRRALAPD